MVSGVGGSPGFGNVDFSAMRQAMLQKTDADGSGGLSLEEFKAGHGRSDSGAPSVENIFAKIDADGDGSVTQTELEADAKQNFQARLQQGGPLSGDNILQLSSSDFRLALIEKADSEAAAAHLEEFAAAKPEDAPQGGPAGGHLCRA